MKNKLHPHNVIMRLQCGRFLFLRMMFSFDHGSNVVVNENNNHKTLNILQLFYCDTLLFASQFQKYFHKLIIRSAFDNFKAGGYMII